MKIHWSVLNISAVSVVAVGAAWVLLSKIVDPALNPQITVTQIVATATLVLTLLRWDYDAKSKIEKTKTTATIKHLGASDKVQVSLTIHNPKTDKVSVTAQLLVYEGRKMVESLDFKTENVISSPGSATCHDWKQSAILEPKEDIWFMKNIELFDYAGKRFVVVVKTPMRELERFDIDAEVVKAVLEQCKPRPQNDETEGVVIRGGALIRQPKK